MWSVPIYKKQTPTFTHILFGYYTAEYVQCGLYTNPILTSWSICIPASNKYDINDRIMYESCDW